MLFFLLGLREDKILTVILLTLEISLSENGATMRKAGKTQDMQINPLTAFELLDPAMPEVIPLRAGFLNLRTVDSLGLDTSCCEGFSCTL